MDHFSAVWEKSWRHFSVDQKKHSSFEQLYHLFVDYQQKALSHFLEKQVSTINGFRQTNEYGECSFEDLVTTVTNQNLPAD
jgi:hypothetical protein